MSASKAKDVSFPLGQLVATPTAMARLSQADISSSLLRHASGDWGEVGDEDRQANEEALRDGTRLFSVYQGEDGTKFWIITEADRSVTTVLLPEDY